MSGRHDFRRDNASDWVELEQVTQRALRRGLVRDNTELPTLLRLHRRLASSLATARAMSAESGLLRYLETLAARSHLALFGATRPRQDTVAVFFGRRIPQAMRRFHRELLLASALLLVGFVLGWALVAVDPAGFFAFVDPDWVAIGSPADRTSTLQARLGQSASWTPQSLQFGWAALAAFGLGVAAGVPSAVVLVSAGLGIGASAGLYAQRGLLGEHAAWFLPHGIPGVLTVLLCGAAGLALGRALLFPRADAANVGQCAREVTPLLVGAGVLFAVAVAIESWVDPPGALGVVLVSAEIVALVAWIGLGSRGGRPVDSQRRAARGVVERDRGELRLRFGGPDMPGLQVTLASSGERFIALCLDLLPLALLYACASLLFDLPFTDWALFLALGFGLRHAYFVYFERRWQGATPGKRLMGLRVMARDGASLDPRSILVRNLLRDVEFMAAVLLWQLLEGVEVDATLPRGGAVVVMFVAVVVLAPLLSDERHRIGDLVADTVVIRTPKMPWLPADALLPTATEAVFSREQLGIYGAYEVSRLAEFLEAPVVGPEVSDEIARAIAARIGLDPSKISDPERFLRSFYRAQRARVERDSLRGRGATGS